MAARLGWKLLAGIAALAFITTAIGGAAATVLQAMDGKAAAALGSLVGTGMVLLFWWWIGLGAWDRAHPDPDAVVDPDDPEHQIGPWGVVGRVLTVLLVVGLVAASGWAFWSTRDTARSIEDLRRRAEDVALRREVTAEQVADAKADQVAADWEGSGGPGPLDELLPVTDAHVVDASVRDGDAAVLIRNDDSPPCVVLVITASGLVSSRTTMDC